MCFEKGNPRALEMWFYFLLFYQFFICMRQWVSLNFTTKSNIPGIPQPWMLLPGHPGGVNWYECNFWTAGDFYNLEQQANLYTKTILGRRRCCHSRNYYIDSKYPPSLLIYGISTFIYINTKNAVTFLFLYLSKLIFNLGWISHHHGIYLVKNKWWTK